MTEKIVEELKEKTIPPGEKGWSSGGCDPGSAGPPNITYYKEELIKQAKQDALQDITDLTTSITEMLDRIFHFAFEAGYEKGHENSEKEKANA